MPTTNDRLITNLDELQAGDKVCLLFAYDYLNVTITDKSTDSQGHKVVSCVSANLVSHTVYVQPGSVSGYNNAGLKIAGGWSTRGFFSRHVVDADDYNTAVLPVDAAAMNQSRR